MHHGILSLYYIFNNDAYFLDFRSQKFPLIFLNLNPFYHRQALHFGVLNYEKQHKEGTCKVSGRWVIFAAFYADFYLCPKSVIITTLRRKESMWPDQVSNPGLLALESDALPTELRRPATDVKVISKQTEKGEKGTGSEKMPDLLKKKCVFLTCAQSQA